jgi:quercetin dioxygenase-like cupin family protein
LSEAHHVVNEDNDRVRVTTWTFRGPGEATGEHRHEFDYVVVPVTGGTFDVVDLDGSTHSMEQVAGRPYLGTAGTEHDVIHAGEGDTIFVEIELKR